LGSNYKEIGKYGNRIEAENQALLHLTNTYNRLPTDRFYKVSYLFDPPTQNASNSHAVWYNKQQQRLSMEFDKPSGPSCSWDSVDINVIKKLVVIRQ